MSFSKYRKNFISFLKNRPKESFGSSSSDSLKNQTVHISSDIFPKLSSFFNRFRWKIPYMPLQMPRNTYTRISFKIFHIFFIIALWIPLEISPGNIQENFPLIPSEITPVIPSLLYNVFHDFFLRNSSSGYFKNS